MKNLFKQNPALLPWLNGTAKFYNDMGNDVAEAYKGKEYHVGTLTYINTVQLVANPEFAKKLGDLDINDYRSKAIITDDNRGIWYELGAYTCALDTMFRFVESVAHHSKLFNERGCKITNSDKALAGQLYDFYTKQFRKLKENCLNNLNEDEVGKYLKFID